MTLDSRMRTGLAGAIAAIVIVATAASPVPPQEPTPKGPNDLRIHFLNIGAGTCTLVEPPGQNARPLVVDCGSLQPTDNDMDPDDVQRYIEEIVGTRRVDVVISHADSDHYGWISTVLRNVRVENLWQGGDPDDYEDGGFPEWLDAQKKSGIRIRNDFAAGFHNNGKPVNANLACGAADCFVLTVNGGESKNAQSLVLRIEHDDFSVTFTGDAEGTTEQDAMDNFASVQTTVLTGSHHGARTKGSNSERWADATSPAAVVFSAGRKFGHPQCEAMARFTDEVVTTRSHPTQCGDGPTYKPVRSSRKAIYMTEVTGRIVITSGGRSPFSVFCSRSTQCSAEIEHR